MKINIIYLILLRLYARIRAINFFFLKICSMFIIRFFPVHDWYKISLFITYFTRFKLSLLLIKKIPLAFIRARDMDTLMGFITRSGKAFSIPFRLKTQASIEHVSGIVLCTVHLPLVKVAIRGYMEEINKIDTAIVGAKPKHGLMAVWGMTEKIPAIERSSHVLLKAKRILMNKGTIVLMIDNARTGIYSPNILHLCGKIQSRLVFFIAELTHEGIVECNYLNPPFPYCESEFAISENLVFLKQKYDQILKKYREQTVF